MTFPKFSIEQMLILNSREQKDWFVKGNNRDIMTLHLGKKQNTLEAAADGWRIGGERMVSLSPKFVILISKPNCSATEAEMTYCG